MDPIDELREARRLNAEVQLKHAEEMHDKDTAYHQLKAAAAALDEKLQELHGLALDVARGCTCAVIPGMQCTHQDMGKPTQEQAIKTLKDYLDA